MEFDIRYVAAISQIEGRHRINNGSNMEMLTKDNWIVVEKSKSILEIFYDITNEISSENQVTLSTVIVLCKILIRHVNKHISEVPPADPFEIQLLLDTLKTQLTERFRNVESNFLYAEATILDKRFKKIGFEDENIYMR